MEKRLRSSLKSSPEEFISAVAGLSLKSSKAALKSVLHSQPPPLASSPSSFPASLHRAVSQSVAALRDLLRGSPDADPGDLASPPSKRPRRSSRRLSEPRGGGPSPAGLDRRRQKALEAPGLGARGPAVRLGGPRESSAAGDLLPAVQALHDNLVLFESDSVLSAEIVGLCEEWWKGDLPGRENLISQFLPFLVSRSLTLKKKVDVGRVYAMREAFGLFDFEDDSIEDMKMLLIRCVISPLYLKTEEGKRFVAFMFGLSRQLVKEAFGDDQIADSVREEVDVGGIWGYTGLIEGAIHSGSAALATSIRRVLGGFINQRTVDGVEKVLFRLTEPVLFRSLQVANSDVRQNALHLLLDVFPLEDPDATKEVKDSLLDRQFYLLERLLKDDCPDVRVVAVEGCCRILNLFWEVIPSSTITKIITRIFDDMAYDNCSEVRLSTINGVAYLLGNGQSHEVLKVLLPRLAHLITDGTLSVRVALIELLLLTRDIRSFQFNKVVTLEALLSMLATDQAQVAQKITRLLLPSYFPSKVTFEEACNRCVTLIKRSPKAGARFCEYAASEGAPLKSLMQLFKVFISFVLSTDKLNEDQIEVYLMVLHTFVSNLLVSHHTRMP
ncbi:condensin-2 complex subunit G2-like [Eucalyptus grandis]|uniref:condensin-2 complex subunit G2-like n=1 Tax=Eucalyptus grandis TaxID=71139 RepID=UPI00192E7F58|nr:condensin-2 complex subunit G2-like [Eucalyptus grandis]